MIHRLLEEGFWQEFLAYKLSRHLLTRAEENRLRAFIEGKQYRPMAEAILAGRFAFSVPQRRELNKQGSRKKRVVYSFPEEENLLLKAVAYLLYRYDDCLAPNCYAFRRDTGARNAFLDMAGAWKGDLSGFKSDISNYFNSIDVTLLLPMLEEVIQDDPILLGLLKDLLTDGRALWQGQEIREKRGVMAGTPISPFLANLYLRRMDAHFSGIPYARYSDDILFFAPPGELEGHMGAYRSFLAEYRLTVNPAKELRIAPGESWPFLGFNYDQGVIDLSPAAMHKLMDKIRRAARSLHRWMLKNNADPERTLRAFNRKFNRKFYEDDTGRELCWSRWYFPVINTDAGLRKLDQYMQQWQRYIVTGRHNKANYRKVPYEMLTRCGYRPLVTAYYRRHQAGAHRE